MLTNQEETQSSNAVSESSESQQVISPIEVRMLIPPGYSCLPSPRSWRGDTRRQLKGTGNDIMKAKIEIVQSLAVELTLHISTLLLKSSNPRIFVAFITEPTPWGDGFVIKSDQLLVLTKK